MPERLTHCQRGHAMTEENRYHPPSRPHKSMCLTCHRLRDTWKPKHMPKPCVDCGVEIAHTGKRPPTRCETCALSHLRAKQAAVMRVRRSAGYKPQRRERQWTPEQVARFWSRVDQGAGCWEWQALRVNGYGYFNVGNWRLGAHRASWEIANGPIPDGLQVRHDCDNPPCVRPDHLRLGTALENAQDAVERQRHPRGDEHWTRRVGRGGKAA